MIDKSKTSHIMKIALASAVGTLSMMMIMPGVAQAAQGNLVLSPSSVTATDDTTATSRFDAYQIFAGTVSGTITSSSSGTEDTRKITNVTWGSGIKADKQTEFINELKTASFTGLTGTPFADCGNAAAVAQVLSSQFNGKTTAMQEFSLIAQKYLDTAQKKPLAWGGQTSKLWTGTNLEGYYLVRDNLNSATTKDSNSANIIYLVGGDAQGVGGADGVTPTTATLKSAVPSVVKAITDDDKNFETSDVVSYSATVTLPENIALYKTKGYYLQLTDTLPNGLTYRNTSGDITLKYGSTTLTLAEENNANPTGNATYRIDGQKLIVTIKNLYDCVDSASTSTKIDPSTNRESLVLSYKATFNADVVAGTAGNTNTIQLDFSNDPNWIGTGTGPTGRDTSQDTAYTYQVKIHKINDVDESPLNDAKFILKKDTNQYAVFTDDRITSWQTHASETELATCGHNHEVTTSGTSDAPTSAPLGLATITGLDVGTYYLIESSAPSGYSKLTQPITLTVSQGATTGYSEISLAVSGNAHASNLNNDDKDGVFDIQVKNDVQMDMPAAGGLGTATYYAIGGVVLVIGGALVLSKSRRKKEEI